METPALQSLSEPFRARQASNVKPAAPPGRHYCRVECNQNPTPTQNVQVLVRAPVLCLDLILPPEHIVHLGQVVGPRSQVLNAALGREVLLLVRLFA